MIKFMYDIDLNNISDIHAITCFEYCYCLALNFHNKKRELLYFKSFYSLEFILAGMIESNQNYITYDDVGRIHHLGNDMDYLNFSYKKYDFKKLEKIFYNKSKKFPIIAKILPEKTSIFRSSKEYFGEINNHLILILNITNHEVIYYNPIIKRKIVVDKKEFENCYDNVVYLLNNRSNKIEETIIKDSLKMFYEHLNYILYKNVNLELNDSFNSIDDYENLYVKIRDSIGVAKVLTRRSIDYINFMKIYDVRIYNKKLLKLLEKKLEYLNKLYIIIEYNIKKKRKIRNILYEIEKINEVDIEIKEELIPILNFSRLILN